MTNNNDINNDNQENLEDRGSGETILWKHCEACHRTRIFGLSKVQENI